MSEDVVDGKAVDQMDVELSKSKQTVTTKRLRERDRRNENESRKELVAVDTTNVSHRDIPDSIHDRIERFHVGRFWHPQIK